jgi:hypothetical protein
MRKCWAYRINYTLPRGYASNLTLPGNSGCVLGEPPQGSGRWHTTTPAVMGCFMRHHNLFPLLTATSLTGARCSWRNCCGERPHNVEARSRRRYWRNVKCADARFRPKHWSCIPVNGAEMCGVGDGGCYLAISVLFLFAYQRKCSVRTIYRIRVPRDCTRVFVYFVVIGNENRL